MLKIDMKSLTEDGDPYQRFKDGVKDDGTRRKYIKNLKRFLDEIPSEIYREIIGIVPTDVSDKCKCFIKMCRQDNTNETYYGSISSEYIKHQTNRSKLKEISPNTVPNYIKPIKDY